MKRILGAVLLMGATAATALAGVPTPEIDPASGIGALAAIGGAMLIIRGRRRRKA